MRFVQIIVYLIVMAVIFGLLKWAVGQISLGEPFNWVVHVALVLGAVAAVINGLTAIWGRPWFAIPGLLE